MTVYIESPSPAVLRNLQALVDRIDDTLDEPSLRLIHTGDTLQLIQGAHTHPLDCPIAPHALLAAIAQHRTTAQRTRYPLRDGWIFDTAQRSLTRQTVTQPLTEKESMLLQCLLEAGTSPCPRETLLKKIWLYQPDIETHTLETHIYRLRQKFTALEPPPCDIETIDGAYRLVVTA